MTLLSERKLGDITRRFASTEIFGRLWRVDRENETSILSTIRCQSGQWRMTDKRVEIIVKNGDAPLVDFLVSALNDDVFDLLQTVRTQAAEIKALRNQVGELRGHLHPTQMDTEEPEAVT
jgi:hypothetical protein